MRIIYNSLFTSWILRVLWPVFYVRQWQHFSAWFVLNCYQYSSSVNEPIQPYKIHMYKIPCIYVSII